jgi:hypothetical protein
MSFPLTTISLISTDFLPYARVLAESVHAHHDGARVLLVVVDGAPDAAPEPGIELLTPAQIGCGAEELAIRALAYETQALTSSLKGLALAAALRQAGGPVLLLDADILVCADLGPVLEKVVRHTVLLSPHSSRPLPTGAGDETFLRSGVFNGGFVGVAPGAEEFCAWWDSRIARRCIRDTARGLMLSQSWLDLVPAMFDAGVERDPGVNVMGHNLHHRDIERDSEGRWTIEGVSLRFFHFNSVDPGDPMRLGRVSEDSWTDFDGRPGVADLHREYLALLRAHGWPGTRSGRYTQLPDGQPITPAMRRAYLDGLGGETPPNPLAGDAVDSFFDWLAAPDPTVGHPGLVRYLRATHAVRADLREHWPSVPGVHTEGFLNWCHGELGEQDPAWGEIDRRRTAASR